MENEYYVYMHVAPNGKRYIGQTCCEPNRRWQNGYGYVNQVFYNAIKKYGWDNFEHIILAEKLTAGDADQAEQYYIELYQTTDKTKGYNLLEGGHGGKHLPEEVKAKIGRANSGENNGRYGHRYSDEEREQMSLNSPWRGRHHTVESRKKMSDYAKAHPEQYSHKGEDHPMFGKTHSEEAKKKMSEAAKRRGYKGHANKRVGMYSKDGEYIKTFDSLQEAARSLKIQNGAQNIGMVCKGKRKTAWGYVWKYAEQN